jgi:pimeloyl-ACP methyl ester carboxylesterase
VRPVLLWYGSDDRMAPVVHGQWQASNLPHASLVINDGEGRMAIYDHLGENRHASRHPPCPITEFAPEPWLW